MLIQTHLIPKNHKRVGAFTFKLGGGTQSSDTLGAVGSFRSNGFRLSRAVNHRATRHWTVKSDAGILAWTLTMLPMHPRRAKAVTEMERLGGEDREKFRTGSRMRLRLPDYASTVQDKRGLESYRGYLESRRASGICRLPIQEKSGCLNLYGY